MVTIRDVAREAHVSIATVSRVFNDSPRVSEAARSRVTAAASKLDYWPNSAARSLTTSRSHALGILLPDLFGEFFSEVIRGIDHAARLDRYQILVSSSHADSKALVAAARSMQGRIDGLVAMVPEHGSAAAVHQLSRKFSTVLLNPPPRVTNGCRTVSVASYDGAYAMVEHLLSLGHRRIAMIKGPAGNVDAEERLRGYRTALRNANLHVGGALEVQGDFSESSGYEAAAILLRARPRPTAVFAANDYTAIGLLGALRDAGIQVPGDIAVAGFDDIAMSQYMSPSLTTVRVDAYELGATAIRSLVASLRTNGRQRRSHRVLDTKLVLRDSCGSERPVRAATPITRRRLQS